MRPLLHIPADELAALGIVEWGYTEELVPRTVQRFNQWLPQNEQALPFFSKETSKSYRQSLDQYWPHCQSAVVFLFTYAPAKKELLANNWNRVAGYALGFDGEDYHSILRDRLEKISSRLSEQLQFEWRISHDTEAILERDLAYRAGLGWFGKNSMLINRSHGSYFMIGSLLFDRKLSLEVLPTSMDHCGTCHACITACPTDAIDVTTRTVRAKDCLATWTIEDRSAMTNAPRGTEKSRGEIFGCDICQDICPWNGKPIEKIAPALGIKAREWAKWFHRDIGEIGVQLSWMTNRAFLRFMENTPFTRPGRQAMMRVLSFWLKR